MTRERTKLRRGGNLPQALFVASPEFKVDPERALKERQDNHDSHDVSPQPQRRHRPEIGLALTARPTLFFRRYKIGGLREFGLKAHPNGRRLCPRPHGLLQRRKGVIQRRRKERFRTKDDS